MSNSGPPRWCCRTGADTVLGGSVSPEQTAMQAKRASRSSRLASGACTRRTASAGVPLCIATTACVSGLREASAASRTAAAARVLKDDVPLVR